MKAIYMKPEMEIVRLQVEEDITWGADDIVDASQTNHYTGNKGFFDDEQNTEGKDSFFDD